MKRTIAVGNEQKIYVEDKSTPLRMSNAFADDKEEVPKLDEENSASSKKEEDDCAKKDKAEPSLTTKDIDGIVERHKDRLLWEGRIEPPRRYFDHQSLGTVLTKDLSSGKVTRECVKTDYANAKWYHQVLSSGQLYKPLRLKREHDIPDSFKEMSTASDSTQKGHVNVAHMIFGHQVSDSTSQVQVRMRRNLERACFNRVKNEAKRKQ